MSENWCCDLIESSQRCNLEAIEIFFSVVGSIGYVTIVATYAVISSLEDDNNDATSYLISHISHR